MNRTRIIQFIAVLALVFATSGLAAAQDKTEQIDIPVDGTVFNPCFGETYGITGTLHLKVHESVNNNTEHFDFSLNTNDIKLTDTTDSDDPSCTGQASFHFSVNEGVNSAFTLTDKDQIKLQCQTGANLSFFDLDHITVNPDGTITASVDNFSIGGSCF